MSTQPPTTQTDEVTRQIRSALIAIGVVFGLLVLALIGLAVFLALNAGTTGPSVEVIRDLVVVIMALEIIIIGVAVIVLLVQIARLVNLLNNEITPLLETTNETLTIVRGTAQFMSKYLAEPVIKANAQVRGVANVVQEVDAIRKAVSPTDKPNT